MSVAWVGAGIAAVGAISANDSARRSANMQNDATNRSIASAEAAQQASLDAQKPFLEGGYAATNRLQELLGLGGDKSADGYGSLNTPFSFTPGDLTQTPGYQFSLQQGQKALDRKASAGGGFYSGGGLKDAASFSQGLAGTTFDNEYKRAFDAFQTNRTNTLNPLQALAGQGQTAANTSGSIQMGGSNTLASLLTGNANAQGASAIARGNSISSGLNNGLTAWQRAKYMNGGASGGSTWGTPGLDNFYFGNGTSGD